MATDVNVSPAQPNPFHSYSRLILQCLSVEDKCWNDLLKSSLQSNLIKGISIFMNFFMYFLISRTVRVSKFYFWTDPCIAWSSADLPSWRLVMGGAKAKWHMGIRRFTKPRVQINLHQSDANYVCYLCGDFMRHVRVDSTRHLRCSLECITGSSWLTTVCLEVTLE